MKLGVYVVFIGFMKVRLSLPPVKNDIELQHCFSAQQQSIGPENTLK